MDTVKEQVSHALEQLDETELQQVVTYLSFLRFRSRQAGPSLDGDALAGAYAAFADEDRAMAEQGVDGYATSLSVEDQA